MEKKYTLVELEQVAKRLGGRLFVSIDSLLSYLEAADQKYVRVRLPGSSQLYTYYCPKAEVGDYVIVPAPPRMVRVEAKGRGSYDGACRNATWVPSVLIKKVEAS